MRLWFITVVLPAHKDNVWYKVGAQQKFIELIQKKINVSKEKIEFLKKYKKGLENDIYQYVKKHGEKNDISGRC